MQSFTVIMLISPFNWIAIISIFVIHLLKISANLEQASNPQPLFSFQMMKDSYAKKKKKKKKKKQQKNKCVRQNANQKKNKKQKDGERHERKEILLSKTFYCHNWYKLVYKNEKQIR